MGHIDKSNLCGSSTDKYVNAMAKTGSGEVCHFVNNAEIHSNFLNRRIISELDLRIYIIQAGTFS